jgi:1,4-dihydroxy-2-naphthoate octaprenyltransferase
MVGGGYFIIMGDWNQNVAVASFAYALGPTSVLFGKHGSRAASEPSSWPVSSSI